MRVKTIGVVLLLLIFSFSYGQKANKKEKIKYYKFAIGISPSSFINNVQGLQFSIDTKINDLFNFSSEAGFIFNSIYSYNVYGYRFRSSFEVMLARSSEEAFQLGVFGLLRNFYEKRNAVVRHQNYTQLFPIIRQKKLQGIGLSLAMIGTLNERTKLEIGLGIGGGKFIVADSENIEGSISNRSLFWYDFPGESSIPIVYVNVNFSYALVR